MQTETVTNGPASFRLGECPQTLRGDGLTISDLVNIARHGRIVRLSDAHAVVSRVHAARAVIDRAVSEGRPIYGVTSGFGGMAHLAIHPKQAAELQDNFLWYHKAGVGRPLPIADVRGAMVLRANALMRGASGVSVELLDRLITFLNRGITPVVPGLGSIGASGDLVPLTYIAGSLVGLAPFQVSYGGQLLPAAEALNQLGLTRLPLAPKDSLSMTNGTSMMTSTAALCAHDAQIMTALALCTHGMMIQALQGTNQSFHPFIHQHKPHRGQTWVAREMLRLLDGSVLSRDNLDGSHEYRQDDLIQDRYSIRCLPQYLGPVVHGLWDIVNCVEVEMNSATDNPLIDIDCGATYHGGNFLGEFIGVKMDQLRYYMSLVAKHLDTQISLLVMPHFSHRLPPCLIGNTERQVNMGLKGLQIVGNSLVPLLEFYGNSVADRFPTHAEQFNQNINSQGFNSANLARTSLEIMREYMALALVFAVQAVDLRSHQLIGSYDARKTLSPNTQALYRAVKSVIGSEPSDRRPLIWNDDEQALDRLLADLVADISSDGATIRAVEGVLTSLHSAQNGRDWSDPTAESADSNLGSHRSRYPDAE